MIRVQQEVFDVATEMRNLISGKKNIGGVTSFVGIVRENTSQEEVLAITLEHYPGMTEKILNNLEAEARERWKLEDLLVIHRYGKMIPGEQIVLIITAASHRQAAFQSCEFLIDRLKNGAPFWKIEDTVAGSKWVKAKEEDDLAADKWRKN